MVEALVLKAERRKATGTREARQLRKAGLIPGIIYGHKEETIAVQLSGHDVTLELQHHHRLLDVELEGQRQKVLVKDVQYDNLYEHIVHIDLTRVRLDERVTVTVRLELRGTPAGLAEGGRLEQLQAGLELECLVTSIPESIRVSVAHLKIGDALTAKEVELPEGVKLVSAGDMAVATVRLIVEEEEAPAAAAPAAEGAAEPEVIAREKPAEEEAES